MIFLAFFLQIGELFKGNFNWQGVVHLFLFLLMGAILLGVGGLITYQAFKSKNK